MYGGCLHVVAAGEHVLEVFGPDVSHLRPQLPLRALINSNDFGRFGIFSRFEFEFWRRGNCTCACAVDCFHTCVHHVQTHSRQRHKQHTQNRHITLPFQLWLCVHVHVSVYVYVYAYGYV